jgi:hypothetical protein
VHGLGKLYHSRERRTRQEAALSCPRYCLVNTILTVPVGPAQDVPHWASPMMI